MPLRIALALLLISASGQAFAQPKGFLYDEEKVPHYELLDSLTKPDGTQITTAEQWAAYRPQLLRLVTSEMYGKAPGKPKFFQAIVTESGDAFDGLATRKQVLIAFGPNLRKTAQIELLLYVPKRTEKPVGVFVGLNFRGNHATTTDPHVHLPSSWMANREGVVDHQATAKGRGIADSRWPYEQVLREGFAVGTIYCGDIDPDYDDGFQNGVHGLFAKRDQDQPAADEWGTVAAWAYGLSRAVDYFETDADIDAEQVAVLGHSRLGKAALWAGATDKRFSIVISNNSGCGGAALSKRTFGETVKRINTSFPHWFNDNFLKYNGNEQELPFDQHHVVALCAPRPVYVASATGDAWADPKGEFLSLKLAEPVYELLGKSGLPAESQPEPNTPSVGHLGYHLREGKHDITPYDWEQYVTFAKRHWK